MCLLYLTGARPREREISSCSLLLCFAPEGQRSSGGKYALFSDRVSETKNKGI